MLVSWFWRRYVRRHAWLFIGAGLLMTIEGGALGVLSYLVRPMFDEIFVAGNRSAVAWVSIGVFVVFLARALAGFFQKVLMALAARKVSADIERDLLGHILGLDSSFFQENPPGVLMQRVLGDPGAATGVISSTFSAFGRDVVALISLFAVALYADWVWTLIAVAAGPLLILPILAVQRAIRAISRRVMNLSARLTTRLDEIFHGISTIKLNGTEAHESRRFSAQIQELVDMTMKAAAAGAAIPALMDVMAAFGLLGVLWYGGGQIIDGEKTVGEFMSFFAAIGLLFEPLRRLGGLSGAWQTALVSLERIYAIFQLSPKITSPARPEPLPAEPRKADLELRDVSFAYGDTPVLRDVSFVAEAGKTTALVGVSGAGKSTVFNLLTRLMDPDEGAVLLGGTDIRAFDLQELRRLFSVVSQDAQMFDESLRYNVLLGGEADEASLRRALEAAHVSDFLPQLPKGIDSPVGPRGSALSGGQRQRVAIARALLRDTPFLLLDEATSALDTRSERIVQQALEGLSEGRTTLVIAHRLSTVQRADRIVVMDQGRVVDMGTHEELIARAGIYRMLHEMQFADGPEAGREEKATA